METYIPTLNKHSRSLVKNLIRISQKDKPITNIESHITLCALDIICGKFLFLLFNNRLINDKVYYFLSNRHV